MTQTPVQPAPSRDKGARSARGGAPGECVICDSHDLTYAYGADMHELLCFSSNEQARSAHIEVALAATVACKDCGFVWAVR
jgi:hypothetical protein